MTAHVAFQSAGNADDEPVVRHIFGDNGSSGDEGVAAKRDAADERGVCAYRASTTDGGRLVKAVPSDLRARIGDVSQNARGAEEDIVFNDGAGVDGDVVLDLHVVPDLHAVRDHSVLAEDATLADDCAGADVGEVPDLRACTDGGSVINNRGGVRVEIHGRE